MRHHSGLCVLQGTMSSPSSIVKAIADCPVEGRPSKNYEDKTMYTIKNIHAKYSSWKTHKNHCRTPFCVPDETIEVETVINRTNGE